ncbi:hypothetical protein KY290_028983 [Solanum tuberosum]|uniref:DNA binding protein n=1 Tax=Solanum tuberosum TaxID=4113 RepID=A0ABQ7ULF8_SOLTU|nr:hypothetical protein KY290_028983 [Solanum tuberosum]
MGRKRGKRVSRVGNDSTVDTANDAVRNDSSVDAVNNAGNVNSQRIQKKDADVSNRDSKNLDLSQADNNAVRNNSSVDAVNNAGNVNSQRIQKKDADVRNRDSKNLDLSQADNDATLNRKLPSAANVIVSADTNQEKRITKDLNRNKSVVMQGSPTSGASLNAAPVTNQEKRVSKDLSRNKSVVVQGSPTSRASLNAAPDTNQEKRVPKDLSRNKSVVAQGSPTSGASLNAGASRLLIPEDKSQTICGRENNVCWAVNEAHGAQLAAEAIEMRKGYPLAEFEKFIRSASPVICPSVQGGQGAPLSRCEIPNISLWNLWQWFEKHGNYGLQVKAEEHTTRRLKFSAYFNPSLSAIQLFKDNRTQGSPTGDFHTGFSLLLPKSRVENSSSSREENVVSDSRASSDCSVADPPVESKLSDELLFEYFEQERPQSRKPFFEKCVELVAADGPSSREDPSILQSTRLPDLHPHSWFCVAWYPIYRIPTGNFHASFLTHHSLGHYIHRGQTLDAPAGVVSPIVGLQSYNAQGECWFQRRYLNEVTVDLVLQERVRTLQQTAFFMSRAVGKNGAGTLFNKHHDYEFFVSRWH